MEWQCLAPCLSNWVCAQLASCLLTTALNFWPALLPHLEGWLRDAGLSADALSLPE